MCRYLANAGDSVVGIVNSHKMEFERIDVFAQDLTQLVDADELVSKFSPDVIVHAAGLTSVDACENDEHTAFRIHADVTQQLARACAARNVKFIFISTDHLWDGTKPFVSETTPPHPINAYARSKLEGERRALDAAPTALVVRTNFFGNALPWRKSLSDWMVEGLCSGRGIDAFVDSFFSPIHLNHLVPMIVEIAEHEGSGVYHVAASERISKYEFALGLCRKLALPNGLVRPAEIENAGLQAPRPHDMSLCTKKAAEFLTRPMPTVTDGIDILNLTPQDN